VSVLWIAYIVLIAAPAWAQVEVNGKKLTLAGAEQGRALLGRADAYIENQTPWERGARMQKVAEVPAAEFLAFVKQEVLDWTDDERASNTLALQAMVEMLSPYSRWMPDEVLLIKTSGREDYGGAYTRQNAIVFKGANPRTIAAGLLAHELWHVISRQQPELRDKLYATIGFEFCGPLQWTAGLDRYRLTNPDCPVNQHWIKIRHEGVERHAMPVITARTERFGMDSGSSLGFLDTRLLMVEKNADGSGVVPAMKDGEPILAAFEEVENFYEQIGRNTTYLIHPEEAVASQVAMILTAGANEGARRGGNRASARAGSRESSASDRATTRSGERAGRRGRGRGGAPASPEILEKMKAILLAPAAGASER
jgi:hypothetical protein